MTTETIDQAKAEAFGGQMVGILNGGILAFMTSIGHRTGLFDKMAELPPSTSQQIADATGLNERKRLLTTVTIVSRKSRARMFYSSQRSQVLV